MVNLSDQELVAQYINTGNDQYFTQIYTRHHQRVYQKCLFYTGDPFDSEDLVQDIFMRLTHKLNSYRGESKFTTWLHVVTANYCIDQLRKQQQNQVRWRNYLRDALHTNEWTNTSDEVYFRVFDKVLSQLPRNQRDLLLSKYKEGEPIKAIASQQALTPSAVKMRIKRARVYACSLYDQIMADEELQ